MKKRYIALIIMFSILFATFPNVVDVYAQELDETLEATDDYTVEENSATAEETQKYVSASTQVIENELSNQETSVIVELENQIIYYERMLLSFDTPEQTEKIAKLVETLQYLIDTYELYSSGYNIQSDSNTSYIYSIATVVAYFNSLGYNLASELLLHSVENDSLDSIYFPVDGDDVLSSSVFTNITKSTTLEGDSSFPNSGGTNDLDLYYAIHAFYYSKSVSNRVVVIQDRYDYELDTSYTSIGGVAVSIMALAQNAGVIVPFYSVITQNLDGTSINSSETVTMYAGNRYYEDKVILGKGEYKDYYITFLSSGNKVFQTFGLKDSYIYLYDENGTLIDYDDDSGYNYNGLISYYCDANVQYKVRVKFLSTTHSGEMKLAIMPAVGSLTTDATSLNDYEDIRYTSAQNYTFNTYFSTGYVRVIRYIPTETSDYIIRTQGSVDTYLYIIDPRSTYLLDGTSYNDDGGEQLNAQISKELSADIPYLIIYSAYSLSSEGASFSLNIYKE